MKRKMLLKKRRLFLLIPLFLLLEIVLGGIIVLVLMFIFVSCENRKNINYCKGANWNTSNSDFAKLYYPQFSSYFQTEFQKSGLILYPFDEKIENQHYLLSYKENANQYYISFEVTDYFCLFSFRIHIVSEETVLKYDYMEKYDMILTRFGKDYFYDLPINEGVFKDLYSDDQTNGYNLLYFDNIIGNIQSMYNFNMKTQSIYLEANLLIRGLDL